MSWAKVRATLLQHPTESYEQIAKRVGMSAPALEALIGDNGGKQAMWAARDALVAKTLAQLAKDNPEASSLRVLAKLAQDALPGLEDFHIAKLKKRHPEVLAKVAARAIHAPVPPEGRRRIAELALAHPTLDYAALAALFAKDPKLKGLLDWSEEQVSRLREPSRILPSERKREAALVELATAALAKAKGSLDDALAKLAETHPGVSQARLTELAANAPALAKQLRRLDEGTVTSTGPVSIDLPLAKKLDVGPAILERGLAATSGGLVSEVSQALRALEKNAGNNDGTLAPRDVAGADGLVALAIARVYEDLGKKALKLETVEAALPAALAALAEKGSRGKDPELAELFRRATAEAIESLASAYKSEVIEGGAAPTHFHLSRKIVSKIWNRIQAHAPAAFPAPGELKADPARLDAISKLYHQLLDGELTTTGFYSRSKIGKDALRLLQATDPDRFPRPAGTPSWKTVVGRREVGELDAKALAKRYAAEVLSGDKSLGELLREEGISKHRFAALRAEDPKRFPSLVGGKTPDHALAKAMGKLARKAFEADVLTDVPAVIAKLNADPAMVELAGGAILRSRYEALRSKFPDEFPKFREPSLFLPVLAEEVRQLLDDKPGLTPVEITKAMRKRHPAFRITRVHQLRELYPELIPTKERPKVDREADAKLLAARMKAHPNRTLAQLADELAPLGERFTAPYLNRLRKSFQKTVFTDPSIAFKPRPMARESLIAGELYAMVVRLAPPGSSEADRARALDALLEARGIPPYGGDAPPSGLVKSMESRHGGLEAQNAAICAQIAAEYARAAPPSAGEKEIFAAILADYPSLDQQRLSTYRNLWAKAPPAALAPFAKQGKIALRGLGQAIAEPRFLGGWDVERALLGPAAKDRALAASLAPLSSHARMPLVLPLLDSLVDRLDGKKPLAHKNLLWVTHVLASTYALSMALRQAGAAASATAIVGTPYGTNGAAQAALRGDGFDVRKAPLDPGGYRKEVEAAIDRMVKAHLKNQQPIVVLDDGGLVAEILRSNPKKYGDVIGQFKIVEQTTRGITAAEQEVVPFPVINVARSKSKLAEGALIGRAVAAKVLQGLERVGKKLKGERVTVVGFGTIGAKIAAELRKSGALVTVVEPSPARAKEAQKAGFDVSSKEKAFPKSGVVIGATGVTSIGLEDLKRLPDGAVFASASSKRLEIDMGALEQAASAVSELDPGSPLVTLPTRSYQLGGKSITALGDGWPVNFDGDVEDIPAEEIQLTRAVMLAGAIQAASIKPHQTVNKGVLPLDEELDAAVLEGFRALMKERKSKAPIGDPSRWRDVLREQAALINGAIDGD